VALDRPLRFCMVTTFYPPYHFGGDAVFVYRLSEALAARGHQIDVIHSADAYRLQHPAEPEIAFTHHPNVTVHPLRSKHPQFASLSAHQLGRPAAYARRIRRIMDAGNYDVIHYHNISLMGGPGVLRFGRALKLYTSHEYWLICPTHVLFTFGREACTERKCIRCTVHSRRPPQLWRYTGLVNRCLKEVDCLIAPSRFALEQLRGQGLACRMRVLPHFVPLPRDVSSAGEHPNQGRPYFLFVGRLEKLKGVQDLLPLFTGETGPSLLIVGGGDYAPVLRAQVQGSERVKFLGSVHPSQIGNLYRHATALLTPSLCYETFGLIAAEGFAHGTPVIGRRIGALAEIIEQSGGGLLFTNVQECRVAMDRLLADPSLREILGARGRAAVLERWAVDVHLESYLKLTRSLIAEKAGVVA
jgi:glycosyltransferase involved in cell wall biosynthesis